MNWELIITFYVVLVISLTVHEAAHALFAYLGGDKTAYRGGQMTLNPLPHMQREPVGMIALPLIMLIASGGKWCFGYAHAPIDPYWAARHPKKAALMSAAGPLSNVLLAAIAFAVLYYIGRPAEGTAAEAVMRIARVFLLLNLLLGFINLLPVPPFDGAGIVAGLYPKAERFYDSIRRNQMLGIAIMIGVFYALPHTFGPIYYEVRGWLPYWF